MNSRARRLCTTGVALVMGTGAAIAATPPATDTRGLTPLPAAQPLPALRVAGANPCNPCAPAAADNPCNPCAPADGKADAGCEDAQAAGANPCAPANPCSPGAATRCDS